MPLGAARGVRRGHRSLSDAFVVRTLLVPSLIALVGPVSAWPGRLRARPPAVVHAPPAPAAPTLVPATPASGASRIALRLILLGIALRVLGRRRP
jgi:uncharacterized membrane protein YdfJ with MMPL/SSD domain